MIARGMINRPAMGGRNPFDELDRMKREMIRLTHTLFGGPESRLLSTGVFPAINLTEDKDHYYIRAELAGIEARDIDIRVIGRNLTISGERKILSEGDNVRYHRREREAGKFSRAVELPGDINPEAVDAKMNNGVLTVTIPKSEKAKPRQITVQ